MSREKEREDEEALEKQREEGEDQRGRVDWWRRIREAGSEERESGGGSESGAGLRRFLIFWISLGQLFPVFPESWIFTE